MKNTALLFISVTLLLSCGSNSTSNKDSSVSGNISNLAEGSFVYLDLLTPSAVITKDTAKIDEEGNYFFDFEINELSYYRLRINNQNFVNLVLNKGEHPVINGDGNNLMNTYSVEGSEESNRLKQFNLAYRANALTQDSIGRVYQANPNDPDLFTNLQRAKFTAINNMTIAFKNLINENPASLVSLAAVEQLDPKVEHELFKTVDEALAKEIPNSAYFLVFHQKVERMVNLFVGDLAPDFTLNDINDNPITLSSLRGNIILLDFWASWCRPCRAENPNVVKAYKKYHKKGFDVINVSLDGMPQQQSPKQDWMAAIEKDGLVWKNHVSDLKGWGCEVLPLYGVEGIPFTLLLDKEGKIIGKNLRGEDLENKLAEIF